MDANQAKIIGMVSLGIGSFLSGIVPAWLSPMGRQRWPLVLSSLLCFGGGVLLATALLHMLPEARETLPQHSELALCGGFFLIYLVDELVHFFYADSERSVFVESHSRHPEDRHMSRHSTSHHSHSYGSVDTSRSSLLGRECHEGDGALSGGHSHAAPCSRSAAGRAGLLLALLLHSVLEGLAIGLQNVTSKVLLLLGAVASHKLVVGFCLGIELAATGQGKICSHIVAITIFSLGSVVGIGAGMIIEDSNEFWTQSTIGILQSLAAGTLLYVTVCEVMPRERANWHKKSHRAGLLQLAASLVGFAFIYLMNQYLDADHS